MDGPAEKVEELVADPAALAAFLRELRGAAAEGGSSDEIAVREEDVMDAVESHLAQHPADAPPLLAIALLPACLTQGATDLERRRRYRTRERLKEILNALPWPVRSDAVRDVVTALLPSMDDERAESACWTILAIGERDERVVERLRRIAWGNDPDSALALRVLCALAPRAEERGELLSRVHERARVGYDPVVAEAILALAEPSSLDVLEAWLDGSDSDEDWRYVTTFRVMAAIAASRPDDHTLQDRVWHLVWTTATAVGGDAFGAVLLGGGVLRLIGSDRIIPDLAGWLIRDREEQSAWRHAHYLAALRMSECVRPRQLEGWGHLDSEVLTNALRSDALADTGNRTRGTTTETLGKEAVWALLLCGRCREAVGWLAPSAEAETSDFTSAHLLDWLACFPPSVLPEVVRGLLRERHDLQRGQDSSRIWPVIAAVNVAWSDQSAAAFAALLHCGFSIEGNGLQVVGSALSDAATQQPDRTATEGILADALDRENLLHVRQAASAALRSLAALSPLSERTIEVIWHAALEEARDDFERATLVGALGSGWAALPPHVRLMIETLATDGAPQTQAEALSVLAEAGVLVDRPSLLERIGLRKENGRWRLADDVQQPLSSVSLIGALYRREPTAFSSAMADLLQAERDWLAIQHVSATIRVAAKDGVTPDDDVRAALRARLLEGFRGRGGDASAIFDYAAAAPGEFLEAIREVDRSAWSPVMRSWLAKAVRQLPVGDAEHERGRLGTLVELAYDEDPLVRDRACAALAACSRSLLRAQISTWVSSPVPEERLRGADASVWLDHGDETYLEAFTRLGNDPDGRVRRAMRVADERRQRRTWASSAFERVVSASSDQILDAWAHAQALAEVGEDDHLDALVRARVSELPQHHLQWLTATAERLEKTLKKHERRAGAQPRPPEGSRVISGQGRLYRTGEGPAVLGRYVLWMIGPSVAGALGSWGGSVLLAEDKDSDGFAIFDQGELLIELENGSRGSVQLSFISGNLLGVSGSGPPPA